MCFKNIFQMKMFYEQLQRLKKDPNCFQRKWLLRLEEGFLNFFGNKWSWSPGKRIFGSFANKQSWKPIEF